MMDPRTIRAMADGAAHEARRAKREPYGFFDESDAGNLESFRKLPFLGTYVPKGYKLVEELFVDSSGVGYEDEPAMTIAAFRERVLRDVRDGNRYSYGITQVGQFQVYIGVFANRREKSRRPSRTRRLVDGHPQVPTLG